MALVAGSGIDHVAYILILYSLASLLFLFVMALIHVYDRTANPPPAATAAAAALAANGHEHRGEARLRDANEFELDGLVSDEEDDEERAARRKLLTDDLAEDDVPLATPSTVGRNNERVV